MVVLNLVYAPIRKSSYAGIERIFYHFKEKTLKIIVLYLWSELGTSLRKWRKISGIRIVDLALLVKLASLIFEET